MARDAAGVYLLIVIAHLCSCARLHVNYKYYNEYRLESERICHLLNKKHTLDMRNGAAAIVNPHHMFDHWVVKADRNCTFVFRTGKGEGLFAVIQRMVFRREGDHCIDYVRFKRSDGHYTNKFCGKINRSETMYLLVPEPDDNSGKASDSRSYNYDMYAEYDPIKQWKPWQIDIGSATIETEIFISKTPSDQVLDLVIAYTPYKNCIQADLDQYKSVGNNSCIRKEYICDRIYNCPFGICADEVNCPVSDRHPKDDTATKVTVGAVTTMILCFIIFVMCLWICKKSQKLCWSSDCAGPNVCSRPVSLPDADASQGSNRAVPTAPMLEVAVSSPVADKDLPPSYDSLFPEQSRDPSRS